MKIIILTLLFGLLGYTTSKPLEANDATAALVEIEKQRLIKFPEELEQPGPSDASDKNDEATRILQEIEKINQALGYVKQKQSEQRMPAMLDSSQYLFPNTGYQPFHAQNPQVMGANGETLLLPSIRSFKLDEPYPKASEYNVPPTKKAHKQKVSTPKNPLYFQPNRIELPAPQNQQEQNNLPTHFVIPVRLYKHNKQQYVEKYNPQEYKVKGYKIVGDVDNFYGKTKFNKTSATKVKSTPKYHLFFLPQEVIAKTAQTDIKANSAENTSREEKLTNRPYKIQSNTQAIKIGNTLNATSSAQIVRKRLIPKPQKGGNINSILSASASTVVKVTPSPSSNGQSQQQQYQKPSATQNQQQQYQKQKPLAVQNQQQQFQTPLGLQQINQVIKPTAETLNNQPDKPIRNPNKPLLNFQNNNNNENNNNNNNLIKNRPLLELQNNINNINNATTNAIKTAFQNIFKLPFRQDVKPQTTTDYPLILETLPLQIPMPQQNYYTSLANTNSNKAQPFYVSENLQNDHLDSDYKWDDENASTDTSGAEDQGNYNSDESREPAEKKIFGLHMHHKQETQNEALRQGGIIIQKLKVRKGGIAIAGPGGVATAGSGGTAIVGPGGYALTHPRSLTIAGPGAKIIAIPSNVDLQDALQRTNLETQVFPREGRIVATGPTVYYSPATVDFVDI